MAVTRVSSYGAASIHSVEHFVNERDVTMRGYRILYRGAQDVQKARYHTRPPQARQDAPRPVPRPQRMKSRNITFHPPAPSLPRQAL